MMQETKVTFRDHAEKVLFIKQFKVRANTFQLHWKTVYDNHLEPYFGDMLIDDIKRNDIELYFIQQRSLSHATLVAHLAVLNEIFNNAYSNDLISKNPCHNFKIGVGKQSKKRNVYTAEQTRYILDFAQYHRFGLDIDILLSCGVSRSELLGIKWEDIDYENKCIKICRSVTPRQGKDNENPRVVIDDTKNEYRTRTIAVPNETMEHIKRHRRTIVVGRNIAKGRQGVKVVTEFLIYNRFGSVCAPDNWYERHYKQFMLEMQSYYSEKGIDIPILSPHELRHTKTSLLVNEGRSLFAIAAQMGWADFDMLARTYGHRNMKELRKQLGM